MNATTAQPTDTDASRHESWCRTRHEDGEPCAIASADVDGWSVQLGLAPDGAPQFWLDDPHSLASAWPAGPLGLLAAARLAHALTEMIALALDEDGDAPRAARTTPAGHSVDGTAVTR